MPLVTLTTDFGPGAYVAQVKGVLLSLAPDLSIIDVSHEVGAGDVLEAAYLVETIVPAFPEGTLHLVVVDPGVGTTRRAIAARYARRILVGPDNGVFTAFLPHADEVREITNKALFLPDVSSTFHGRDLFAPVAAHLAAGAELSIVGPRLEGDPVLLRDLYSDGDRGLVLAVDRFGNIVTSFPADVLAERPNVYLAGTGGVVRERATTFGTAEGGLPFLYAGSGGRIQIAVAGRSAAELLGWERGSPVTLVEDGE